MSYANVAHIISEVQDFLYTLLPDKTGVVEDVVQAINDAYEYGKLEAKEEIESLKQSLNKEYDT